MKQCCCTGPGTHGQKSITGQQYLPNRLVNLPSSHHSPQSNRLSRSTLRSPCSLHNLPVLDLISTTYLTDCSTVNSGQQSPPLPSPRFIFSTNPKPPQLRPPSDRLTSSNACPLFISIPGTYRSPAIRLLSQHGREHQLAEQADLHRL